MIGAKSEVALIWSRMMRERAGYGQGEFPGTLYPDDITDIFWKDDKGIKQVITVMAFAGYMQIQIYFGRRGDLIQR